MPGFPTAPAVQTVTDKLATIAPELGNVPGYYVYLKDPIAGTIYESASVTDSGGNWSIAGVTMGLTYQYSYGVHPNTAYPFKGAYVAANPLYELGGGLLYNAANPKYAGGMSMVGGATDDFGALKNVVAAATVTGGVVRVPQGSSFCKIDNSGNGASATSKTVTIRGAGRDETIISTDTAALTGAARLFSAAAGASIALEDMTLIGPTNLNANLAAAVYKVSSNALGEFVRCRRMFFNGWDGAVQGPQDGTAATCDLQESEFGGVTTPVSAGNVWWDVGVFRAYDCNWHDFGLAASNQKHAVYLHQSTNFDLAHDKFDNNQGLGWCVQVFGGTAGTATEASFDDIQCGANAGDALQSSPTVLTKITNLKYLGARRAVTVQFDTEIDLIRCDGSTPTTNYIQQLAATAACKVRVRSGIFNQPGGGNAAIQNNIAGTDYLVEHCNFPGFTQATSLLNSGGGTYTMRFCNYSDTKSDALLVIADAAAIPTITAPHANIDLVTNPPVVVGNASAGSVTVAVITATIVANTTLLTVTYRPGSYTTVPIPVLCNASGQAGGSFYVVSYDKNGFTVRCFGALAVGTGYKFTYQVRGV